MKDILKNLNPKYPITKDDYLDISHTADLPSRCPIIEKCERHQRTLELIGNQCGVLLPKRAIEGLVVPMMENVSYIGGSNSFLVSNCCPEVGLFESEFMFCGLEGYPLTSAQYDKYLDPQYQILETSHFSRCVEFVNYDYYSRMQQLGITKLEPEAAKVVGGLRKQAENVKGETAKAFIDEAIGCFETGHYRSAVVVAWLAALGVLQLEVITNHLDNFNSEARRVNPSWKSAVTTDDLGRLREFEFLDRLVGISVIGKNVKDQLKRALDLRNGCGHPSSLRSVQISWLRIWSFYCKTYLANLSLSSPQPHKFLVVHPVQQAPPLPAGDTCSPGGP